MVLKAAKGAELTAAQHISLKNIRLLAAGTGSGIPESSSSMGSAPSTAAGPTPVIYIENSSDLLFDFIGYNPGAATVFSINGGKCSNIRVEHTDATGSGHPAIFNYGATAK